MATQGEKRSHSDSVDVLEGVKVALFDVEGTLSPLTFVKNKLYPYVRENLKTYLENHWDNEECQADVTALRKQVSEDKAATPIPDSAEDNRDDVIKAIVANVVAQMDGDSQSAGLRTLQSHMYREAYKTGKVQGEVFDDVVAALKKFSADGIKVYTFSSNSSESQKLLLGYTEKGDLSEYFSGYFDSETGGKADKASYTKIAGEAGVDASAVMFFTDLPAEAAAAAEASFKTTLVERDGNAALTDADKKTYSTVSSLSELLGDAPPSKKADAEEGNGAVDEEADSAEADDDDVDDEEVDDDDGDDGVDNGDS